MSKPYLHLPLDPGPNRIGLGCKLSPEPLIRLLPCQLLLQHLVTAGHQLSDLKGEWLCQGSSGGIWPLKQPLLL